ncbi:AraC family transcriptional regulator [Paenibacillus eucommiae]|uniref:AraC-like DNA-binding protein n=1 Tax=Paenibacillus eucommiae TaxID=1355755 RepID=A0ABS4J732_9BACL|nr:helix-turn-helix domain-containing protein [Paenibacillus eucommiae]MBP1995056.1 AraC-like DNA-binding protein [Paenibacillus eucommiae]
MSFKSTRVLFISRCKYKYESYVINHCHNFHHLLYVVGGSGTLLANGVQYNMHKNDMYIIPPDTNHSLLSDASRPLCTIEVKALVNDPQLEAYLKLMSLKMVVPNVKIKMILEAMLEEAIHCRPQYKEIITANFIEFIMNIQRSRSIESQEDIPAITNLSSFSEERDAAANVLLGKTEFGDDVASKALQYFHGNYDQKIILKELAQQLAVSRAHLCRVFCERYKVSPMQYLNNWRIQEAKELLVNTELSITEISARVGFQTVHYLSRRFTAKEKMSPLQYRQKMKEIIELKIEEKYHIVDQRVVMHS